MDSNPVQPAMPFAARDHFQLLNTHIALNVKNNQIFLAGRAPGGLGAKVAR